MSTIIDKVFVIIIIATFSCFQVSMLMDKFETQFENLDVQTQVCDWWYVASIHCTVYNDIVHL